MIQALLTIDDIPSNNTRAIVDYLNKARIQAVMFAIGKKLKQDPEPVIYAIQHGMIIGNHGYFHLHFSSLNLMDGIGEIDQCTPPRLSDFPSFPVGRQSLHESPAFLP